MKNVPESMKNIWFDMHFRSSMLRRVYAHSNCTFAEFIENKRFYQLLEDGGMMYVVLACGRAQDNAKKGCT